MIWGHPRHSKEGDLVLREDSRGGGGGVVSRGVTGPDVCFERSFYSLVKTWLGLNPASSAATARARHGPKQDPETCDDCHARRFRGRRDSIRCGPSGTSELDRAWLRGSTGDGVGTMLRSELGHISEAGRSRRRGKVRDTWSLSPLGEGRSQGSSGQCHAGGSHGTVSEDGGPANAGQAGQAVSRGKDRPGPAQLSSASQQREQLPATWTCLNDRHIAH